MTIIILPLSTIRMVTILKPSVTIIIFVTLEIMNVKSGDKTMSKQEKKTKITHLEKREIQAPLVASLVKRFAEEFGEEKTHELAKKIICEDAVQAGKDLAAHYSGNSLADLLKIVEEVWAGDGIMEIKNVELKQDSLQFDVTRCGYADMYERLRIKELGTVLSCCRDFAFMDGFNPGIRLERTKTIMEGDELCNFRYRQNKT